MTRRRDILIGCLCAFKTVVAIVVGAILLGESFTVAQTVAAAVIVLGVWIANRA